MSQENWELRFIVWAPIAECDETLVHLDYLYDTKSLNDQKRYEELRKSFVQLSKQINNFTQWVEDEFVWKRPPVT